MLPVDNSFVTISRSHGLDDLDHPLLQQIQRRFIIDDKQKDPILHLPTSDIDMHLLQAFKRWNNSLATYGLEISTGPVVAFRALDALTTAESVEQGKAVPLLWLQHIRHMSISWPLENFDKPQAVLLHEGQRQLVKNVTQIILRRFSAKEEPRRITAAVLSERTFGTDLIALENHLNYLYRPGGTFAYEEAVGLAAFLNSSLVDRYFRIMSGNTQVSATELRNLPLPSWEHFVRIGEQVVRVQGEHDLEATEHIIMDVLGQDLVLGSEEDIQLIDRNPDDPIRPTNSPNTCYALTNEALETLKQYGSQRWEKAVAHFLAQHGALWEQYQRSRQAVALPLKLADGAQFYLTPGKHNELQVDIVEKFGPRYARNALVLYLGDAANKFVIYEREKLEQLGVPITNHDKLPDVILYQEEKNWLYLIEAVTSHGPVSHKRKYELEKLLQNCTASPIYITAFHTTREFRRHAAEIAWETEVWIAETPEHMIHYNGDRFEGPHEKTTG